MPAVIDAPSQALTMEGRYMVHPAIFAPRSILRAARVSAVALLATLAASTASSQNASGPIKGTIDYGYWGTQDAPN